MSYWDMLRHTYGDDGYDERSSDALSEKAKNSEERNQNEQRGEKTNEAVVAQETIKEFQEHPEKIGDLVKELIDLRGDKDVANGQERFSNIKREGEWNKELRASVGADGLPRDWAHLTGFLKKNPDRIADVLKEINELKEPANKGNEPENVSYQPEEVHYNAYDEDSGMTDAVFDRYANKEQETQETTRTSALEAEIEEETEMEAEKDAAIEAEMEAEAEAEREKAEENKAEVEEFRHKVEELVEKFDKKKAERINNIQKELASLRPELAELYAKNRRLFVTHKNRELFQNAQTQYNKLLNELLSLKTEQAYKKEQSEKWSRLSNDDVSKAHSDLKKGLEVFKNAHPNATKEELIAEEERLKNEITTKLLGFEKTKEKAGAAFLSEYLKQQGALEEATIDALDNGTIWRRFTHKVIDNKNVKTALAVLGAAGFAASIIATGGIASIGFAGWAGVASGAARGALSGAIMSRQDSKNSAVRRLATEEELKKQFEEIAITSKGDVNINNVASFLVGRYESANETDRSNNRKRTLISAGIGAAIGGIMGGVQLNKTITSEKAVQGEPELQADTHTEIRPDIDIDSISHARGKGTEKLFLELGGESSEKYYSSGAHKMLLEIGKKYGLTPGKSGWTHPGHISEWPSAAQGMAREVAEEWAKYGLIPSHSVDASVESALDLASEPIADAVGETVKNVIFNNFAQGSATVAAGAIGGLVGGLVGKNNRINQSASNTPTSSRAEVSNEEDLFMDNTPDFEQNVEIPQANVENAREAISRLLGALGQNISDGDLGLIIRDNERPYSDAESAQLEALWGGLDEDTRSAISQYMAYEGNGIDSRTTDSFLDWLNSRGNESPEASTETPPAEAAPTESAPEAPSTPSTEDTTESQESTNQEYYDRLSRLNEEIGGDATSLEALRRPLSQTTRGDAFIMATREWFRRLNPENKAKIVEFFNENLGSEDPGRSALYSIIRRLGEENI